LVCFRTTFRKRKGVFEMTVEKGSSEDASQEQLDRAISGWRGGECRRGHLTHRTRDVIPFERRKKILAHWVSAV